MTEQELIRALVSIRGVKSAAIDILGADLVKVNIRYRLWVYLIPGAQERISAKAQKFIDFIRPIGIQIEVADDWDKPCHNFFGED
jgi:hypothetical protein